MQREKLARIEAKGESICFWGLLAAILIQLMLGPDFRQIIGELAVFAVLSGYMAAACVRQGIWTRSIAPTLKNNAIGSAAAAAAIGVIAAIRAFAIRKLPFSWDRALEILITVAVVYALCFVVLEIVRRLYQSKRNALDDVDEETESK